MKIVKDGGQYSVAITGTTFPVYPGSRAETFKALEKLTGSQIKGYLITEKIVVPASMEKKQLFAILCGIVQIEWMKMFDPDPEKIDRLVKAHVDRVKRYTTNSITAPPLSKIGQTSPKLVKQHEKKDRKALIYKLTKKGEAELQTSEAKQVVILYKNLKIGPSTQRALTELVTGTDFTKSPNPSTIVAYYLSVWKKQGWLEEVS